MTKKEREEYNRNQYLENRKKILKERKLYYLKNKIELQKKHKKIDYLN